MNPDTLSIIRKHFKIPDEIAGSDRRDLELALARGIADAQRQGNVVTPDAEIVVNPKKTIPDWGVGGYADGEKMIIPIDKEKIKTPSFKDHLSRMVTHELNHNGRNQPIHTLADALVSEGLAQAAEVTAGHEPAFYSRFADKNESRAFSEFAFRHLDDDMKMGVEETDEFGKWFYGEKAGYPQPYASYGGYKLGYALVTSYMVKNHLSLADAIHVKASDVMDAWKKGEISPDDDLERNARALDKLQAQFQQKAHGASIPDKTPKAGSITDTPRLTPV